MKKNKSRSPTSQVDEPQKDTAKLAINWDFQEAHSFLEALKNWGVEESAWDCWLNDSNPRKSD